MIKPGKYDPLKPDIILSDHKSKKTYGLKLDGQGALQIGNVSQDDTVHIRSPGKNVVILMNKEVGRVVEELTNFQTTRRLCRLGQLLRGTLVLAGGSA